MNDEYIRSNARRKHKAAVKRDFLPLVLIDGVSHNLIWENLTMADPFKAPKFEVPSEMRDLANKSVEQAKRAFDSFMGATQQAAGNMQGSTHSMLENAAKATKQVVGFAEQNVNAALLHAQAIVQAKGFEEVMKLQTDFMRNQMGAMQSQMKAMGETVQTAASSASQAAAPKAAAAKTTAAKASAKPAPKSKK